MRAKLLALLACLALLQGIQARQMLIEVKDPFKATLMDVNGSDYMVGEHTYYESLVQLGQQQAGSAGDCAEQCRQAECSSWSWCPTSETDGCVIVYRYFPNGTEEETSDVFPPGTCTVMNTSNGARYSLYQTKGSDVTFVSGVRTLDWLSASGIVCREPPPESLVGPSNTLAAAMLAEGTQNFTCNVEAGKYELVGARTDLYYPEEGEYSSLTGNRTLIGYLYTAKGPDGKPLPTFVFTSPDNETVLGEAVTARAETYDVVPAKGDEDAVWYRRAVIDGWGRGSAIAWVVRTDTKGGAAPKPACTADDPRDVQVPITAYYTFYMCGPPPEPEDG